MTVSPHDASETAAEVAAQEDCILVVENDPETFELLENNLREAGYAVSRVVDARQATDFLLLNVPTLVIIDWSLPGISGMQLLHQIRAESRFRRLPLIMLAGRSAVVDRVAALQAGADDYVTKPFSPRELVARVRTILRGFAAGNFSVAVRQRLMA